jgi:CBS domain containing-hemolysin-like protein
VRHRRSSRPAPVTSVDPGPLAMSTALGLVAFVLLVLATGYFVAAEFAFVAARRPRLAEMADAGDRRATSALALIRRLSFALSGAQLGITITSLITGYLAGPLLADVIEPVLSSIGLGERTARAVAVVLALVVATTLSMVLGELAPKNLAIARPEPLARALAPSVTWYLRLFGPVVRLFDGAANALLRLAGVEPVEELASSVSADELDYIVEESARHGSLTERQAALLSRALEFPERTADEVMVPRSSVVSLPVTARGADVRALLRTPHARFPVTAGDGDLDDVVGVVHAEDLVRFPPSERDAVEVTALLRDALSVPETATLTAVLEQLRGGGHELALVVDEYGGVSGVLTVEDIVEELVGDIADEHDVVVAGVEAAADGTWLVPGAWRIDEIERATGLMLPKSDDYDTVGGLVMGRLGRIPNVGDTLDVDGLRLRVTEMGRRQVALVQIGERPE